MKLINVIALIGIVFSIKAHATPIVYDESVDGDLSHFLTKTFEFDKGINVITGQTKRYFHHSDLYNDMDAFIFNIDEGLQVTSIVIELFDIQFGSNNLLPPSGEGMTYSVDLKNYAIGAVSHTTNIESSFNVANTAETSHEPFTTGLPLGADAYEFGLGFGLGVATGECSVVDFNCGVKFDYRLSFEVTSVSEPAAFSFIMLGLLGLIRLQGRKTIKLR